MWAAVLGLSLDGAQDRGLERVKGESAKLRELRWPEDGFAWKKDDALRDRTAGFEAAIRDWVESRLPRSRQALDAQFPFLKDRLEKALGHEGLMLRSRNSDDLTPGFIRGLELSRPAEDGDELTVTAGVAIPCGSDDAVYVYDYRRGVPRRVLESHGAGEFDESISGVQFSKRDAAGNQLILTLRRAPQCAGGWNSLSYDLFRWAAGASGARRIFGGRHGIFLAHDKAWQVRLEPDDVLMEIRARSIDSALHDRAHVLHFKVTGSSVERIDPVALQPRDFVDEWLTRGWAEMESRSAKSKGGDLKKWHEFLGSSFFVGGDFQFVQPCLDPPDETQVAVDLGWIQGKELPEGLRVYFMVRRTGQYRFQMTNISFHGQEGCPGEAQPDEREPTLFPEKGEKQ